MSAPVLLLSGVVGGYGGRSILNGVDLAVAESEIVCLIGHNGAGKSTVLKAIYGMLPRERGEIAFRGQSLRRLAPHQLLALGIAYVPQNHTIFPKLTVAENIRMGGFLLGGTAELRARTADVLRLFPILEQRGGEFAASLSGGEQRMLEIARALMMRPALLMLDEPSIGLAPRMVDLVFDTVGKLREQGLTILMVEQNVRKALARADRACILEQGRIRVEGAARAMLDDEQIGRLYLGGLG
jgi:branched-chain amino acid transport system ATP-binding protein